MGEGKWPMIPVVTMSDCIGCGLWAVVWSLVHGKWHRKCHKSQLDWGGMAGRLWMTKALRGGWGGVRDRASEVCMEARDAVSSSTALSLIFCLMLNPELTNHLEWLSVNPGDPLVSTSPTPVLGLEDVHHSQLLCGGWPFRLRSSCL